MIRTLTLAVIGLVALAGAMCFYAPLRLFAIAAAGRSPVCPMAQALKSVDNAKTQLLYKDRILAASKRLAAEPGFHLWDTPHGKYWVPEGSDYVLPFNLAEQERRIYGEGQNAVRAGDVVLDCGANVGVYTRVALDAGAKLVIAIEPAPENLECLRRNFKDETAAGRVVIYPKGVWDKDDVMTMQIDPHNSAADTFVIHLKDGVASAQVPLTTIDKLAAELKLERVDFIKMDIEGAEQRALSGARETLAKFHPRMALSAYHRPDDPEKIPPIVKAAWPGYRMECGPCAEANARVRPDVLYFR